MADQVKVVTLEGDEATLDAMLDKIQSEADRSGGVPAKGILVLANRSAGKAVLIVRFNSEAERRLSVAPLDAFNPPNDGMRRVLFENYEVVLER